MKDYVHDLNRKDRSLRQLVNNEKAIRQEIEEIKSNGCKFKRELDMVQREKKGLVELLEVKKGAMFLIAKSSEDCVSSLVRLVDQRTHRQVHFGQDLEKPLEQRASRNSRTLPRMRRWLPQDFSSILDRIPGNCVYAPISGENQLESADSVRVYGSSINNGGRSDNFSVKHHEKGWPIMSGCLDQEVTVQEIMQVGLSSAGNNEDGDNFQAGIDVDSNNFQAGQKVEM